MVAAHPCQTKLHVNASSRVDELGFSRVDASQHHGRVALLPEVYQVPVVTIDVPVLNNTKRRDAFHSVLRTRSVVARVCRHATAQRNVGVIFAGGHVKSSEYQNAVVACKPLRGQATSKTCQICCSRVYASPILRYYKGNSEITRIMILPTVNLTKLQTLPFSVFRQAAAIVHSCGDVRFIYTFHDFVYSNAVTTAKDVGPQPNPPILPNTFHVSHDNV